jgi:predicted nucleotidyltransferase
MPELGGGLLGCYRCGYVWRLRKSPVRLCPRCKSRAWDRPEAQPSMVRPRQKGVGIAEAIGPRRSALLDLAAEYGMTEVRVFGSLARGTGRPDSDVDLLVRFRRPIGLLARMDFKERATRLLNRRVDLSTMESVHWLIRPRVAAESVML